MEYFGGTVEAYRTLRLPYVPPVVLLSFRRDYVNQRAWGDTPRCLIPENRCLSNNGYTNPRTRREQQIDAKEHQDTRLDVSRNMT